MEAWAALGEGQSWTFEGLRCCQVLLIQSKLKVSFVILKTPVPTAPPNIMALSLLIIVTVWPNLDSGLGCDYGIICYIIFYIFKLYSKGAIWSIRLFCHLMYSFDKGISWDSYLSEGFLLINFSIKIEAWGNCSLNFSSTKLVCFSLQICLILPESVVKLERAS